MQQGAVKQPAVGSPYFLDVDEVKKYIIAAPNKSCSLDPIPTTVLKQCVDATAPVFTLLVNASLECAEFSPELKRAFITPLLKKAILDCEILKKLSPCLKPVVSVEIDRAYSLHTAH